jgi:hypothetical protein
MALLLASLKVLGGTSGRREVAGETMADAESADKKGMEA